MTIAYINTLTLEYPRHIGDIELVNEADRNNFVAVEWADPPAFDSLTQIIYELPPINSDGTWYMQWGIRNATEEELAFRDSLINK